MGDKHGTAAPPPPRQPRPASHRSPQPARVTLRHLCLLGLPAPMLLPSLLPVLRELVPADHASYFFCDDRGTITNLYAERLLPPPAMARYHDRHGEQAFRQRYLARVAAAEPVSWRSVTDAERASGLFPEVLVPLGIEHMLHAIVRRAGRAIGQLSLYRGADQRPFERADAAAMEGVLHYLAQALSVPPSAARMASAAVEEGLAVFDDRGREWLADPSWARLVQLAHGHPITPAHALAACDTLPRFVQQVLAAVQRHPGGAHEEASLWGAFRFKGHPLRAADGAGATALRVARLAPDALQQAQGAAALALSPQQREVAVLMAQGLGNAAIAQQLSISANTASYHAKQVFRRLEVHDRAAIAQVLAHAAANA